MLSHLLGLDAEVGVKNIQYGIQVTDFEATANGDRCQFRIVDLEFHY
jgi:hypothetical protein